MWRKVGKDPPGMGDHHPPPSSSSGDQKLTKPSTIGKQGALAFKKNMGLVLSFIRNKMWCQCGVVTVSFALNIIRTRPSYLASNQCGSHTIPLGRRKPTLISNLNCQIYIILESTLKTEFLLVGGVVPMAGRMP